MDLYAYAQINELHEIAEKNGIAVPRLRGYRLMSEEQPINVREEIDKKKIAVECVKKLCEAEPFWNARANCFELSGWTDFLKKWYLTREKNERGHDEYIDVRWNRIHGWKRKTLKTMIHGEIEKRRKQWNVWNKYAGRNDVLYVHARIGGGNWSYYFKEVINQPWFIERVDDAFDCTYCDLYARIKVEQNETMAR